MLKYGDREDVFALTKKNTIYFHGMLWRGFSGGGLVEGVWCRESGVGGLV